MGDAQKNLIREVFLRNGFAIKDGRDDLADYVYAAAQELLQAAPAVQGEPVGWQFYQDGEWWYGDDRIKLHRKNTEAAGIPVRDVYAAPQPVELQPAPDVAALVEALEQARDAIGSLPKDALGNVPDTQQCQGWHIRDELINDISTALAAHRKGGGQ